RAAAHNMTLYEWVRDPTLYPLATYLDAADRALERDVKNQKTFVEQMSDSDEGVRYWAVVGLFLLEGNAAPAVDLLEKALSDPAEEVQMMAAWALIKLGEKEKGFACLETLQDPLLKKNIQRWVSIE